MLYAGERRESFVVIREASAHGLFAGPLIGGYHRAILIFVVYG